MLKVAGRPRLLLMSSLFYFRIPRPLWGDRLRTLRRAGYTAVDVYIPWNYHEICPGRFDFTGERDVGYFLQLCYQEGLSVIARPGPYVCSEWDGGGIPAWLYVIPGMDRALRQNHPLWLAEVERWFGQVLPLIAPYQDRGGGEGPIIAIQLENELDFFPCTDPSGYLEQLARMARARGIVVPLLACSGQDRIEAAGGRAADVVPTVNLYPREDDPGIEERVDRLAAQLCPEPILVTETGRSHYLLRRLLAAGAKLLGPYLQTSGNNFGYWAGQNDWAEPTCFQPTVYDFGGMIDSWGRPRWPEYQEAQLLSQFVTTFEPELLASSSEPCTLSRPARAKARKLGPFLALIGLSDHPEQVVFQEWRATAYPRRVRFLPHGLSLARFGIPFKLEHASAELVSVETGDRESVLTFLGAPGESINVYFRRVTSERDLSEHMLEEKLQMVTLTVPGETSPLPGLRLKATPWPAHGEAATPASHHGSKGRVVSVPSARVFRSRSPVAVPPAGFAVENQARVRYSAPVPLEVAGVYRGYAWYQIRLANVEQEGLLFFASGSDILSAYWNGEYLGTLCPRGLPFVIRLPRREQGLLAIRAEIWGHSNFHHTRAPALRLGSTRGLDTPWGWLVAQTRLILTPEGTGGTAATWRLHLRPDTRDAPGLDHACPGSSSARLTAALFVTGLTAPARLYGSAGEAPEQWIWPPAATIPLDKARVELLCREGLIIQLEAAGTRSGRPPSEPPQAWYLGLIEPDVSECVVTPWDVAPEAISPGMTDPQDWQEAPPPHSLKPGEVRRVLVRFAGPAATVAKGVYTLELDGRDCKGVVYLNGRLVGRFWFGPAVAPDHQHSSLPSRFYLPECWLVPDAENDLLLVVEGISRLQHPEENMPWSERTHTQSVGVASQVGKATAQGAAAAASPHLYRIEISIAEAGESHGFPGCPV